MSTASPNPRARGTAASPNPRARGTAASPNPRARGTPANPRARGIPADALLSPSEVPGLPTETLRLLLDGLNLVTTGRRPLLIARLQEAFADGSSERTERAHRAATTASGAGSMPSTSRDGVEPDVNGGGTTHNSPATSSGAETTPESGDTSDHGSDSGSARESRDVSDPPPDDPLGQVYPSDDSDLDSPYLPPPAKRPLRKKPERHTQRSKTTGARHRHKRSRRQDTPGSSRDSRSPLRRRSSPSPSSSPSSSSYSSSPSSSSSSTTGSGSSDDRHRSRHRSRHRRRHHRKHQSKKRKHRRRRELVSCIPPLSTHLRQKIIRGEYVDFDRLLLPSDVPPLASASRSGRRKHASRHVSDRASWQESWNQYIATRVAHNPSLGLALAKYQAILGMLFNHHPPAACITYDRLFRQGAARDPSVRWDRMNEEIFVWALTPSSQVHGQHPAEPGTSGYHSQPQHFGTPVSATPQPDRNPSTSCLGPAPSGAPHPYHPAADPPCSHAAARLPYTATEPHLSHTPEGREICKRYNFGQCTRPDCHFAHLCWTPACAGTHPGEACPRRPF